MNNTTQEHAGNNLDIPICFTDKSRSLAMMTGAKAQRALLREHFLLRQLCGTLTEEYINRYIASNATLDLHDLDEHPDIIILLKKRDTAAAKLISQLRKDLKGIGLTSRQVTAIATPVKEGLNTLLNTGYIGG